MKITEELRESWRKEFEAHIALGVIRARNNPEEPRTGKVEKVFNVKYIVSYSGAEAPSLPREAVIVALHAHHSVIVALHAHHAVSIVLGRGEVHWWNVSIDEIECDDVKWNRREGWLEEL